MYELVKKILDKSVEEGVTVDVGYDMVANEIGYTDELKKADAFIHEHYEKITALRVKGKEADIKILCAMAEKENTNGVEHHIENLKDQGVI